MIEVHAFDRFWPWNANMRAGKAKGGIDQLLYAYDKGLKTVVLKPDPTDDTPVLVIFT